MAATAIASPPLPSLWAPIAPVVPFGLNEHQLHTETDTETMALPNIFFVQKMVTVLQDLGYSWDNQRKVAELVDANTIDAIFTPNDETASGVDAGVALSQLLFDEKTLQSKSMRLNSNEPVLLIRAPKAMAEDGTLEEIKMGLLAALRSKGVKPVRVYLRTSQGLEAEIQASLLNVVNTNLGGPSMVQLLDAAFEGESWKQELVSKEAWNGYDLIWHAQAGQQKQTLPQQEGVEEYKPKKDLEVVPEPEVKPALQSEEEQVPRSEAEPIPQSGEQHVLHVDENVAEEASSASSVDKHPKPDEEKPEVLPVEHPEMIALREREAQRIAIQHPSWAREHEGESLLDIITTQSAGMSVTDPISVIIGSSNAEEKDDFEVVEKP